MEQGRRRTATSALPTPIGTGPGWVGDQLVDLEVSMDRLRARWADGLDHVHPEHRADAENLVDYVALRGADVRALQDRLSLLGVSSLGRAEPHVRATLHAVRRAFEGRIPDCGGLVDETPFTRGRTALDRNTDVLLGPPPRERATRIMVTLPSEAADDPDLVRAMVARGMDVARVNGAHDTPEAWRRMIRHVRSAADATGRPCRVAVDTAGPKLRTGPFLPGPEVVRIKPMRDARGVAVAPGTVVLGPPGSVLGAHAPPAVTIDAGWLTRRRPGDRLALTDARGSRRRLTVVEAAGGRVTAEVWDTTYVERGTVISCGDDLGVVGPLEPVTQHHVVTVGDPIVIRCSDAPVAPWRSGQGGVAVVGCPLPEAFAAVRVGDRVYFDDGDIAAVVDAVADDEITVRVVHAAPNGTKLRAEKGINLPDTELAVPPVSDVDAEVIEVAARDADMLALSFVRSADDVDAVLRRVVRAGRSDLGLVVKVETAAAFARLPEILVRAMQARVVGVMIARGDLAIEAGYARLAEVQEEILWLCEAARLPVVWATGVLDRLARHGSPSRAEITDAAMAQRAECVMLNKGPHMLTAIETLDDILRRMSGHQRKKVALMRPLRSWEDGTA